MEPKELSLNRDYMHTQFTSWRLQPLAKVTRHYLSTTGHASGVVSTALDFLHTRASVLRNHLLLSESRVFVFTQSQHAPGFLIYELMPAPASEAGLLPVQVAELPAEAGEANVGGAVEAVVDCSLAVVAAQPSQPAAAAAPAGDAATHTDTAGGGSNSSSSNSGGGCGDGGPSLLLDEGTTLLLASRGHGDITLVRRQGANVSYSNVVHPLRPRLPYAGVRPLVLEAAVMHDNGDITAVAWAMRSKGATHAACCEVFAIRLRATAAAAAAAEAGGGSGGAGAPALSLVTTDVRLLLRTKLPPHLVRPAAAHGAVLMGFDPDTAGLPGDTDAEQEPAAAAASTTAAAAAGTGQQVINDDDDDMDPRTLEQAAARLAAYTSEERQGAAPAPQWTDVYKESGPDGLGAMGAEPLLELAAWGLDRGGEQQGAAGAAAGHGADKAPLWRLQCGGAHRLLSTDNGGQAVGVTDDVDCAVVGADWPSGQGEPQVRHMYSIPALSYVVAGKTYKRHVLLADAACGGAGGEAAAAAAAGPGGGRYGLAAVLVESQRFMYLYGSTTTMEEYGKQQVVDLGLEEGENVLGARLVDVCIGGGGAGGHGSGSGSWGQMAVVVATQRRLLSFRLKL